MQGRVRRVKITHLLRIITEKVDSELSRIDLDQPKAFDRIEYSFLESFQRPNSTRTFKLEFASYMQRMQLVELNEVKLSPFIWTIRQGCSLSSMLSGLVGTFHDQIVAEFDSMHYIKCHGF